MTNVEIERRFPDHFLFGAATSSHQVEGGNRGNDWWAFEKRPSAIHDGSRSGSAAEWWDGRAEEDLSRAAEMGHDAHRMSFEWSRLEPEPGRFDRRAVERYRAILEHLHSLGMEPMVTLHHFTLPRWIAERGGWCSPAIVERFTRYAAFCGASFGDLLRLVSTLNEPSVLSFMAYAGTEWPPASGRLSAGFRAARTMLAAHASGRQAFLREAPRADVGLVLNVPRFEPADPRDPRDVFAAKTQDWAFSGAVLTALATGRLPPPLGLGHVRDAGLAGSLSFLGLNYYGRFDVRFDPMGATPLGDHVQEPTIRTEHADWGAPDAHGLFLALERLSALGVPLYVTENGIDDAGDDLRPSYLVEHIRAVSRALAAGVDVRGYFHWSLIDNFEWAEGYSSKFGLFALERGTQARRKRRSAEIYSRIIRARGIPAELDVPDLKTALLAERSRTHRDQDF